MIKYITRANIDIESYDQCITQAVNTRIYAQSTYLDIVADNWDALVLNNYEAVMLLPWRRKYGIQYIYPPNWTQQLGVFSKTQIDADLVKKFLNAIPRKFLKTTIQFNADCPLSNQTNRNNYILKLDKTYAELFSNYRRDRKQRLKKYLTKNLEVVECNKLTDIVELFKADYRDKADLATLDFDKLIELSKMDSLNPLILKINDSQDRLISGALFFKDKRRIYYLFSANSKEGKNLHANSGILDYMIQKYAATDYTLDFEGSMIPGVASFFKSFGSEAETYVLYGKRLLG